MFQKASGYISNTYSVLANIIFKCLFLKKKLSILGLRNLVSAFIKCLFHINSRTIYAGNAVLTLKSTDPIKIITVRSTAFEADAATGGSAAEEALAAPDMPKNSEFVSQELSKSDRPELASAKVRI